MLQDRPLQAVRRACASPLRAGAVVLTGLLAVALIDPAVAGGAVAMPGERLAPAVLGRVASTPGRSQAPRAALLAAPRARSQMSGPLATKLTAATELVAPRASGAPASGATRSRAATVVMSKPATSKAGASKAGASKAGAAKPGTSVHRSVPGPPPTIDGDRATIATLEREIVAEGAVAEHLVAQENVATAVAGAVEQRLANADQHLATDRAEQHAIAHRLADDAVAEYVNSGSTTSVAALVAPGGVGGSGSGEASVYADAAAGALDSLITSYDDAQHRVSVARVRVDRELRAADRALAAVRAARAAADAAVQRDDALLTSTKKNLRALLAAAAARQAAIEAAEEAALAAHPPVTPVKQRNVPAPRPVETAAASGSSARTSILSPVTAAPIDSGGYADPLRAISGLAPSRIDQGVDYCGYGPIYAMGDGTVLSTYNGGWPGGTFITYELTSGPAAGLVVYAAEDINPAVSVGESVTSDTVIGTVYEGPTCIETGWADGGEGDTMAMVADQFYGANSTAFGLNYSELLQSLGAPGGVMQNPVATGSLPADWPGW
ncbi:MAG TPA: hypothetical protein VMD59_11365 [Acidimicrobiales bacterium]|nr:hypothetical protein [Acidimicrobiales bacterium]